MKNIPKHIYLQTGSPDGVDVETIKDFDDLYLLGDVTWCKDEISKGDTKYIRADIVADMLAALQAALNCYSDMTTEAYSKGADEEIRQQLAAAIAAATGEPDAS